MFVCRWFFLRFTRFSRIWMRVWFHVAYFGLSLAASRWFLLFSVLSSQWTRIHLTGGGAGSVAACICFIPFQSNPFCLNVMIWYAPARNTIIYAIRETYESTLLSSYFVIISWTQLDNATGTTVHNIAMSCSCVCSWIFLEIVSLYSVFRWAKRFQDSWLQHSRCKNQVQAKKKK